MGYFPVAVEPAWGGWGPIWEGGAIKGRWEASVDWRLVMVVARRLRSVAWDKE